MDSAYSVSALHVDFSKKAELRPAQGSACTWGTGRVAGEKGR